MACYHPMKGYRRQDGKFTYKRRDGVRDAVIPCGGCVGCRQRLSGEWAVRGTHEASMHLFNSFVTLTYDSKRLPARESWQLPADVGLYYPDFQLFMMRLRKRFGANIRYMVVGEYGDQLGRPHWHVILFNFRFPDVRKWYVTKQKHQVFRSEILEELWPFGNSDIGSVTPSSIAYVARYVHKKINGDMKMEHYVTDFMDPSTGEFLQRQPEFGRYSLKPGIGATWFAKYHSSVYPHDWILFNGRKVRPPRYYDKLYTRMTGIKVERELISESGISYGFDVKWFSDAMDEIKDIRIESAKKYLDDCTPDRLAVREQVALSKLASLKRSLT